MRHRPIGSSAAFFILAVHRNIFRLTKCFCNFLHHIHHIGGIGSRYLRMRRHHIRPLIGINVRGLRPFPIRLSGVHRIFFLRAPYSERLCKQAKFPAALHHKPCIFCHSVIIIANKILITEQLPVTVGNQHTCIRPSHRAVQGIHIEIYTAVGCNLWESAVLSLPVGQVTDVFSRKRHIIHKIPCRNRK